MAIDLTQCSSDEGSASSSDSQLHSKDKRRAYTKSSECETLCSSDASASDTPVENEATRPSRRRHEEVQTSPDETRSAKKRRKKREHKHKMACNKEERGGFKYQQIRMNIEDSLYYERGGENDTTFGERLRAMAAETRPEWDPDLTKSNDARAVVGIDPVLPAKRHQVPGAIWWERRSHVENTPLPCDDLVLVRVRGTDLLRVLLRDGTLDAKAAMVQQLRNRNEASSLAGRRVLLMLEGLEAAVDAAFVAHQGDSTPLPSSADLEEARVRAYVRHQVDSFHTRDVEDTMQQLLAISRHFAEKPYRPAVTRFHHAERFKTKVYVDGSLENHNANTWVRQLQVARGVSEGRARALFSAYATPAALFKRYCDPDLSLSDRKALLQHAMSTSGDRGRKHAKLSERIHTMFCARDPKEVVK